MTRVVVVGAGIIGAACAYYATRAGLSVTIVERRSVCAGTTGAGEGNLLVSDKQPGPELTLALRSARLWADLDRTVGAGGFEMEHKGGVVVARTAADLAALEVFAAAQRAAGVAVEIVGGDRLPELEPFLAPGFAGGAFYPGDLQVQPMLAAASMIEAAVAAGARLHLGIDVTGLRIADGRLRGVRTSRGVLDADFVVNAAGTGGGALSERFGAAIPVSPRRGFVLVTEPLPPLIRHKVYSADYVANVASGSAGLETSSVIEGTRSGTVLIGASRERVGLDRTLSVPVIRLLAARAVAMFPVLAGVHVLRTYAGFRPYCPDHLPVVGHDGRVPGLLHACGHEGAGIGLAPATGELITQLMTGEPTAVDPAAFSPDRLVGTPV